MKEKKRGNFHVDKDLRGTHVKATLSLPQRSHLTPPRRALAPLRPPAPRQPDSHPRSHCVPAAAAPSPLTAFCNGIVGV